MSEETVKKRSIYVSVSTGEITVASGYEADDFEVLQNNFDKVLKKITLPSNVIFYGAVDRKKVLEFYRSSSLFVLPSIEYLAL